MTETGVGRSLKLVIYIYIYIYGLRKYLYAIFEFIEVKKMGMRNFEGIYKI